MMYLSHNELVTLCSKTYDSLHRQCGESDVIANMVADLEMSGLKGVKHFVSSMDFLAAEPDVPVGAFLTNDATISVDLKGASLLNHFPALVDVSMDQMIGRSAIHIEILNSHNRWFAYGELLKLAGKGLSVRAQWSNSQAPFHVDCVWNAGRRFPDIYFSELPQLPKKSLHVDVQQAAFTAEDFGPFTTCITAKSLSEAERRAWRDGIEIDESHWQTLKHYASRNLVESSEQSKMGAGGQ